MYYQYGRRISLRKLGMETTPNFYQGAKTPTNDQFSANARQDIWQQVDSTPIAACGSESAVGMPSSPEKSASETGVVADGSFDGWQNDPSRLMRLEDAVHRAFVTNQQIDESFGTEPSLTQPKLANSFFNVGSGLRTNALSPRTSSQLMSRGGGIGVPKSPTGNLNSTLSPTKMPSIKPPSPMKDKLVQGANSALMGGSLMSPQTRFVSPV